MDFYLFKMSCLTVPVHFLVRGRLQGAFFMSDKSFVASVKPFVGHRNAHENAPCNRPLTETALFIAQQKALECDNRTWFVLLCNQPRLPLPSFSLRFCNL
jgi:hypothetical protein